MKIYYFQAKLETKALKAKRPGFTDERYNETSYYQENGKCILHSRILVLRIPCRPYLNMLAIRNK